MKTIAAVFVLLLSASSTWAHTFECQTLLNLDAISSEIGETELKNKVKIDENEVATVYLTQKNDTDYVLEVFLPATPMRIYSEASVIGRDSTIAVSAWTHDYIVDVNCRRLN